MYCKKCGNKIYEDSVFCKYCGANVSESDVIIDEIKRPEDNHNKSNISPSNKNNSTSINPKNSKRYIITILIISVIGIASFLFTQIDPVEKVAGMSNSVFLLNIYNEEDILIVSGSGFLAFDDMTVVTNYHVIQDAYRIDAISENNVHYEVTKLIDYDSDKDVAILELDSHTELPVLKMDSSYKAKKGDQVFAIGSPLGIKNTVSDGIISTFVQENEIEFIQFTAPISSGSSGGALFNTKGDVIGITAASFIDGQNINLAIPIEYATNLKETCKHESINIEELNINSYGTKPINVGKSHIITKYLGYYYHNFNSNYEIMKVNSKTGEIIPLGIYGQYVNVYNNDIYYMFENKLHMTDLQSKKTRTFTRDFNSVEITDVYADSLFVNKNGIFMTCYYKRDDQLGSFLGKYNYGRFENIVPCFLLNSGNKFTDDSIITIKNRKELSFIGLNDLKEYYSISMENYIDSPILISFNIYNDYIIYQAGDNDDFVYKLDLNTGNNELLYFNSDIDKSVSIQAVYKDYIYFHLVDTNSILDLSKPIIGDTYKVDINGNNLLKISNSPLENLNFIEDSIYFYIEQDDLSKNFFSCDLSGRNLAEIK